MIYKRSLDWRLDWSLRTCLSSALATFLALGFGTVGPLQYAFAAFVCIMVKDSTFGATLKNGIACIFASSCVSVLCYILITACRTVYSPPLFLFWTFLLCVVNQFIEYHGLSRKLAASLMILNLVSVDMPRTSNVWARLLEVIIGVASALFGTLLPYPHLASVELETQSLLSAEGLAACFDDVVIDWQYRSIHSQSVTCEQSALEVTIIDFSTLPKGRIKRWNVLRATLRAISCFKSIIKESSSPKTRRWCNVAEFTRANVRREVLEFLEENLEKMKVWVHEAKFGPSFVKYSIDDPGAEYIELISNCIFTLKAMESKITSFHKNNEDSLVYYAFQERPNFRRALRGLSHCIGQALKSISMYFAYETEQNIESVRKKLEALEMAKKDFNNEYELARKRIYYSCHENKCKCSLKPLKQSVFLLMNSFYFLLDAACRHIENYWRLREEFHTQNRSRNYQENVLIALHGIVTEIFPPQTKNCTNLKVAYDRLSQSVIFSLSIVLAGIYGLYSNVTTDTSLAAFTIAYLHGGAVLGANVITSISRSMGTVAASVYAIIILQIVERLDLQSGIWVRGFATVLFQLPATYLRTYPLYGYTGTVAGFTAAILLLVRNPTTFIAMQRVVDTYVGVAIYILGQLALGASFSEDELLNFIESAVNDLKHRFVVFRQGMSPDEIITPGNKLVSKGRIAHLHKIQLATASKRDIVRYISMEPSLLRPKPFRRALLDEFLMLDQEASKIMLILFWSLEISMQTEVYSRDIDYGRDFNMSNEMNFQSMHSKFSYVLPSLHEELKSTEKFMVDACQHICNALQILKKWKTQGFWYSHDAISFSEFLSVEKNHGNKTRGLMRSADEISILVEDEDREISNSEHLLKKMLSKHESLIQQLTVVYWDRENKRMQHMNGDALCRGCNDQLGFIDNEPISDMISSAELKVVNSILCCLKDLLQNVEKMGNVVGRLTAFRSVHSGFLRDPT